MLFRSGLTASSAEQHDREVDEAIAQDELDDAQLDDTLSPDHYDASDLKVLEGLEAVRIRPGMEVACWDLLLYYLRDLRGKAAKIKEKRDR